MREREEALERRSELEKEFLKEDSSSSAGIPDEEAILGAIT